MKRDFLKIELSLLKNIIPYQLGSLFVNVNKKLNFFEKKDLSRDLPHKARTKAPPKIKAPPAMVFTLSGSPKNTNAKIIVNATLIFSRGATFEASPICRALK